MKPGASAHEKERELVDVDELPEKHVPGVSRSRSSHTLLPGRLASKIERVLSASAGERLEIADPCRLSSGASSQTYVFEARSPERRVKCVVQLDDAGARFAGALSKSAQARVQQLAFEHGVLTPEVLLTFGADDDSPAGFVTRLVAGEALGQRVVHAPKLTAARASLGAQCASALAAIHLLPTAAFDMLPPRTAAQQLQELAQLHRSFGQALPVFSAALAWLEQHVPPASCTTVVHGDFRTGNLLVDETGLRAVLDWELAHLGDPLEDLGWLCVRSWRFGGNALPVGGFATRQDFFEAYSEAAQRAIIPAHVRFWQMLGTLKWGVICQWFAARRLAGEVTGCEPALIGRRVSEVELSLLDLLAGEGL